MDDILDSNVIELKPSFFGVNNCLDEIVEAELHEQRMHNMCTDEQRSMI